jgi:hypothetical protein
MIDHSRATLTAVAFVLAAAAGCRSGAPPQVQMTATTANFTSAAVAEVRNAQGQVLLTGKFAAVEEEDDGVERKATLTATSVDADAAGEAEVEVDRTGNPPRQEVELSITNVQPGGVFTFVIDGVVVATITADDRGRASFERDIPLPR